MFRKLASIPKGFQDIGGGFYRKAHEVWQLVEASDDENEPFKLIRIKSEKKFQPEAKMNKQAGIKKTASMDHKGLVFRAGNLVEVRVLTDDGEEAEVEHEDGVLEVLPSCMVHDAEPNISNMQMIPNDSTSNVEVHELIPGAGKVNHTIVSKTAKKDSEKKFKPTQSMANNASRGMEYRKKNGGKGGTEVGVGMARKLINRTELSQSDVNKMHSFFSRHEGNKKVKDGKKPYEDNGHVAWLLWGGDSGKTWAASRASSNKKDEKKAHEDKGHTARLFLGEDSVKTSNIEQDVEDVWATIAGLIRVSPTILIRDVRERSKLPTERVDRALLQLAREEMISLLEHDRPLGVDPDSLLWNGGKAYNALVAV